MAGNAGKKRNRLRTGASSWKRQLTLDESYGTALEAAATASGEWAPSLYLQRLLEQVAVRDAEGNVTLPPLSAHLDAPEEDHSAAA